MFAINSEKSTPESKTKPKLSKSEFVKSPFASIRNSLRSSQSSRNPSYEPDTTKPTQIEFNDTESRSKEQESLPGYTEDTICCREKIKCEILHCNLCLLKVHASCVSDHKPGEAWICQQCKKKFRRNNQKRHLYLQYRHLIHHLSWLLVTLSYEIYIRMIRVNS